MPAQDTDSSFDECDSFTSSNYWLTFINISSFIQQLYDPQARSRMQPALVFACSALATLLKSSELEAGSMGRDRALHLRDLAQSYLTASWNSRWIDLGLAEAAMASRTAFTHCELHPYFFL